MLAAGAHGESPYADRAMADKAQALLANRGMKVQVIDF